MKKVIQGELVEGTPEEILAYERALQRPYTPSVAPIVDEATNEERLRVFQQSVGVTPAVAARYVQQVRLLAAHIAPRPVLSAGPADIAAVRDQLLSKCAELATTKPHTLTPGVHYCKAGLFERAWIKTEGPTVQNRGETPAFCATSCAKYRFAPFQAATFLIGVKRFFDHYEDLVPRNPARKHLKDFLNEYDLEEYLNERHSPTLETVATLLQRARDLRGKTTILLLAKTGRRIDEIRRLTWNDIDLQAGVIDLSRVREEKRRAAGRGRTKMRAAGFHKAVIDHELAAALRDYHKLYWSITVRRHADGSPMTSALWLDQARSGPARRGSLEGWIDAALRDAGLWKTHGPDSDARLTAHSFRHFFTTVLQSGPTPAPREYVKLLRGDVMGDAMQRYEHMPIEDIQATYMRHMPRLLT